MHCQMPYQGRPEFLLHFLKIKVAADPFQGASAKSPKKNTTQARWEISTPGPSLLASGTVPPYDLPAL